MNNCLKQKKDLFGQADMRVVAKAMGDLHYQTLAKLFGHLADEIFKDAVKGIESKRRKLGMCLFNVGANLNDSADNLRTAWKISKPVVDPID